MGKKKSIVLMVLLTIVIVILCAITVIPTFPIGVKDWNPVVMQNDFGADVNGGYYAYYYPKGIISETDYKNLDADKQEEYSSHKGLYFKNDTSLGVCVKNSDGTYSISEQFKEEFEATKNLIVSRYEKKGYSDFSVAVVDDYALKVQLPKSATLDVPGMDYQTTAFNTIGLFAEIGELELKQADKVIEERNDYEVNELIKKFSVITRYDYAWIKVEFTEVGKTMIKEFRESASTDTLNLYLGDIENPLMQISATEHVTTRNTVEYALRPVADIAYVETMVILLNSSLNVDASKYVAFEDIQQSDVCEYEAVHGENTLILLYVALAVITVGLIAFSIVKMGGFGVASAYSSVSYLIVVAMFYAFVSKGVFEFTLGSALAYVLGLVLMNVLNVHVYNAIKAEFALGKTVESSVKGGYRKTIWNMVDVYAVLLLGSITLLIGAAGLATFAWQAIICVVMGAFCNLLWTRVINVMLLSASKNKYKYFRFVREDDDDE